MITSSEALAGKAKAVVHSMNVVTNPSKEPGSV